MKIDPSFKYFLSSSMSIRGAGGILKDRYDVVEIVRDKTVVVWSGIIGPTWRTKNLIRNRL